MKELIAKYAEEGESCSHIILKAAAEWYGLVLSEEMINSCRAITAGFGIGGICSALVAAVMVLGIMFDEEEAKTKSLLLFSAIQGSYKCMDCARLAAGCENCTNLLLEIGENLEQIIDEGR